MNPAHNIGIRPEKQENSTKSRMVGMSATVFSLLPVKKFACSLHPRFPSCTWHTQAYFQVIDGNISLGHDSVQYGDSLTGISIPNDIEMQSDMVDIDKAHENYQANSACKNLPKLSRSVTNNKLSAAIVPGILFDTYLLVYCLLKCCLWK